MAPAVSNGTNRAMRRLQLGQIAYRAYREPDELDDELDDEPDEEPDDEDDEDEDDEPYPPDELMPGC